MGAGTHSCPSTINLSVQLLPRETRVQSSSSLCRADSPVLSLQSSEFVNRLRPFFLLYTRDRSWCRARAPR